MGIASVFLVGFGGVIVGGFLTGVIELWRQLLDGRAAARIIEMELSDNSNRAIQAVTNRIPDIRTVDSAWRDLRVKLAPLLPQAVLFQMSNTYSSLFIVDRWIQQVQQKPEEAKQQVQDWFERASIDIAFLKQLSRRSRIPQMVDLLRGKPTFPPRKRGERPTKDQLADMKKKLFEGQTK